MRSIFLTFLLLVHAALTAHAQATVGCLTYNTVVSPGKFVPIYGVDPHQPTKQLHGNDETLYVGREPIKGTGFWAELWVGTTADPDALTRLPATQVHFKATVNAVDASRKVDVPGSRGGDTIFIQLRVWDASVSTWAEVAGKPSLARGLSPIASMRLAGSEICEECPPFSSGLALEGFSLWYPIPEPSFSSFAALGIGALIWCRPRS